MNRNEGKPVAEMERADLSLSPIWEWRIDEEGLLDQDETWVRPTSYKTLPHAEFAQFLVSAIATLRDGTQMPACVEVMVARGRTSFRPAFVFMLDRQLEFAGHETTRLLSRYTKQVNNHPHKWELNVLFDGERSVRKGRARSRSFAIVLALFDLFLMKSAKGKGQK